MADAGTDIRTERKPKLSERVVAALRSQVLSGEISPGQKMPTENQLTETFGVSRTVIREAIATLAADGLVEPRQGAGVFVRDHPMLAFGSISLDIGNKISQAINVLEVRMGIEIESAGLAALRHNSAQEAAIQEAFFEFERLLALDQATGKTDFAFHRAIAAATGNPFYVEVLDALGARKSAFAAAALLDRPGEPGLDGARGLVDIVAVEAEAGFEAEAVAGAEADRLDADVFAGFEQRVPEFF